MFPTRASGWHVPAAHYRKAERCPAWRRYGDPGSSPTYQQDRVAGTRWTESKVPAPGTNGRTMTPRDLRIGLRGDLPRRHRPIRAHSRARGPERASLGEARPRCRAVLQAAIDG